MTTTVSMWCEATGRERAGRRIPIHQSPVTSQKYRFFRTALSSVVCHLPSASRTLQAANYRQVMPTAKGLRFRGFVVPESELEWSFDPSGGPGGQHANRSSTRVTLAWNVAGSATIPEPTRSSLLASLGIRARSGVVTVTCDETRSQWRNRSIARHRLVSLLDEALEPIRTRHKSIPSRSARRRRLERKRHRGETKRLRKRPELED